MHHKVCGFYKLEAVKKSGKRRLLADWFPNLILDQGLDYMALHETYLNYCHVGSGNSVPTTTDIGLNSVVATTSTINSETDSVNGSSPYYVSIIRVFRFGQGVAAGNLSEVGIGWSTGANLFSRSLILDGGGSPTTITVLSDEYLDVTYEFRYYPYESDVTGSVTLTGGLGGTYGYTLRVAKISTLIYYGLYQTKVRALSARSADQYPYNTIWGTAYDGGIGSITGQPTGNSAIIVNIGTYSPSYTNGTYSLDSTLACDIAGWNLASGIKSILFTLGYKDWQIEFDSPIMKTNEDILSLTFNQTWDRYTP